MTDVQPHLYDVIIIGAGFTGLGMAIRLHASAIHNFLILECAQEVGGTWRDNHYPGAACDIPSNLYSYSFAPNPSWSRSYPSASEILKYLQAIAEKQQLNKHIRFTHTVTSLSFNVDRWFVDTTAQRTFQARTVVMATGPLNTPGWPQLEGRENFAGKVIHSARWDADYEFEGKRVAVIGTGASAIQIVPELTKQVKTLTVYQRTAPWILPRFDFNSPSWNQKIFRKWPKTQSMVREGLFYGHEAMAVGIIWNSPLTTLLQQIASIHRRRQVKDPWLRAQVTPDYRIGCKRVLLSNDWYPALQQPNVELITWPIVRLRPEGVQTAEGLIHGADCLIFATGFEVNKTGAPFPIVGTEGVDLGEKWRRGAYAYKSINVAGYPNLFLMPGPNSGPGHNSYLYYMEAQIEYAMAGIRAILSQNLAQLDVRESTQTAYNKEIQRRLKFTNWNSGCKSWYLTEDGFNATMYPGFASQYASQMHHFRLADYKVKSSAN